MSVLTHPPPKVGSACIETQATPATELGLQKSPFWLDIGHELAHQQDIQKNGIAQASIPWLIQPDGKVLLSTEKYATHMENKMRADANLPLRTHYSSQGLRGWEPSRILNNGVSVFYNKNYRIDVILNRIKGR